MSEPRIPFPRILYALLLLIFLAGYNWSVMGKEKTLANGETVVLRLAPVDPLSLMQGAYMILDFAVSNDLSRALREEEDGQRRGVAVLRTVDGVDEFVRLHQGEPLRSGEKLLKFKIAGRDINIAGSSFFFEEGQEHTYAGASFAALRVDSDGTAMITGLLDGNLRLIVKNAAKLR